MGECVTCNLCGSSQSQRLFTKQGYGVLKCDSCGLVYVNPRPTAEKLIEFYDETDSAIYNSEALAMYELYTTNKQWVTDYYYRLRLKGIQQFCSRPGKLLDVGCASGVFLAVAQEAGWQVHGFEPSKLTSRIARDRLGLRVSSGRTLRDSFEKQCFDVVTVWDVLEHSADPVGLLGEINDVLKHGGILQLRTPNIDSLLFHITRKNWLWLMPPYHLYYFSPATLEALLAKAGFTVIEEKSYLSSTYLSLITLQLSSFMPRIKASPNPKSIQSRGRYAIFQVLETAVSMMFYPMQWFLRKLDKGAMIHIYATK